MLLDIRQWRSWLAQLKTFFQEWRVYSLVVWVSVRLLFFFFQAEDGIRDSSVTGVQTCALPIYADYRQFAIDCQQAIRELAIVRVVGILQGQLDGLTQQMRPTLLGLGELAVRSEERRVGKECRSRWSPYH